MRTDTYITQGAHIVFRFFQADLASLSGMQMKFGAKEIAGRGVVRNVWADDPLGKKNLRFNVEREDGSFIEVPVTGVIAVTVLQEDGTAKDISTDGIERVDP